MEQTIRKTRQMVIDQMLSGVNIPDGSRILEPSAGSGDLVEGIYNYNSKVDVDCVELNKTLRESLYDEGYNVIGKDFLNLKPNPIYDFVIACPTYKDCIDTEHIMHMYEFLKPNGKIISLTHPIWTIKNFYREWSFRKWLEDKDYSMKMLHDKSFVEEYETQPSMVITIIKH